MAKFLPFVVAKSTPIHIFQTLVSRSKGMNDVLVASIFYLVLEQGIDEVRASAGEIPDGDVGSLYEKLLMKYPSYRIPTDDYAKMQTMLEFVTNSEHFLSNVHEELREYTMEDILAFLTVMISHGKISEYTDLNFQALFDGTAEIVLSQLNETGLFANDQPQVAFGDMVDLRAYAIWHALISPDADENPGPVTAVYGLLPAGANAWQPKAKPVPKKPKHVPGARKKPSFGKKRAESYNDGQSIPPMPKPSTPSEKEEWSSKMDKLPWEAD